MGGRGGGIVIADVDEWCSMKLLCTHSDHVMITGVYVIGHMHQWNYLMDGMGYYTEDVRKVNVVARKTSLSDRVIENPSSSKMGYVVHNWRY